MTYIPINLAIEDVLSEAVLKKLLNYSGRPYSVGSSYRRGGYGYLRKNIHGFNNAAKGTPFLVLTDLDRYQCAPDLIRDWLKVPKHPNLILRVAVKEIETWLLADRVGFAKFLGISKNLIRMDVESIEKPKEYLISLAKRSRKRLIRVDIVPLPRSTAKQGRNYNGRLISFVNNFWNIQSAQRNSPSLQRAIKHIETFNPYWQNIIYGTPQE
jgi:hypothetical protein